MLQDHLWLMALIFNNGRQLEGIINYSHFWLLNKDEMIHDEFESEIRTKVYLMNKDLRILLVNFEAARIKYRSGNIHDLDLPIPFLGGDGSIRIRPHGIGADIQRRLAQNGAIVVPFDLNGLALSAGDPHPAIHFIRGRRKRDPFSDNFHFVHIQAEFQGFNFHSVNGNTRYGSGIGYFFGQ